MIFKNPSSVQDTNTQIARAYIFYDSYVIVM